MTSEALGSLSEYRDGIHRLLPLADFAFDIFDPDLVSCGLETSDSISRLTEQFNAHRHLAMRIVGHDPGYIEQHCPRLLTLCRLRSEQIHIRVSALHHRNWQQPFALVDGRHLLTRFHVDSPRGKLCLDDTALTAQYLAQFETLFQASTPGPNGAFLGI